MPIRRRFGRRFRGSRRLLKEIIPNITSVLSPTTTPGSHTVFDESIRETGTVVGLRIPLTVANEDSSNVMSVRLFLLVLDENLSVPDLSTLTDVEKYKMNLWIATEVAVSPGSSKQLILTPDTKRKVQQGQRLVFIARHQSHPANAGTDTLYIDAICQYWISV